MFRTILIVDDNAEVLKAGKRSLRRRSRTVYTAENREKAVKIVTGKRIDLVFVDLILEKSNGIDLIVELKTIRPELVAVLMSAYASIDVAVEAALAGAARVKPKPFFFRDVVTELESKTPQTPKAVPKLSQVEREYIQRVLDDCDGNVSRAARCLGLARSSLYRKLGPRSFARLKKTRSSSRR